MKYSAVYKAADLDIPFKFSVDKSGEKIEEFEPKELRSLLTGQALLAHKKYQLLLKGQLEGAGLIQTKSYITHHE